MAQVSCRTVFVCLGVLSVVCFAPANASAQDPPLAITADVLFYGDNSEFANQFRRGETLLGNAGRVVLNAGIGNKATLVGGVFGDRRFGADSFDLVRPVFALNFDAGRSQFTFGTLNLSRQPAFGPDRGGPHGLLPPIQRDTMLLTRPYEAGLQWTHKTAAISQEFWINWQRLNTPAAREAFDTGAVGRVDLNRTVALAYQSHIVHHGGQLYSAGVVSDSWVAAPGVVLTRTMNDRIGTLETYGLLSRYVPDRERLDRATTGAALFARGSIEDGPWRAHLVVWRGNDYIKEEGDPNYGGLRRNGSRFRKVRDYAELGITRVGNPVPELQLEGSARLHRVESHYEYSYRILGRVTLRWPL